MTMSEKRFFLKYSMVGIVICGIMTIIYLLSHGGEKSYNIAVIDGLTEEKYYIGILANRTDLVLLDSEVTKDLTIQKSFEEYVDVDGFVLNSDIAICHGDTLLCWKGEKGSLFKVLIYYPQQGSYVISSKCRSFSHKSIFKFHVKDIAVSPLIPVKCHASHYVIASFICRICIVIWVEIGIALLFGYRERGQFLYIGGLNLLIHIGEGIYLLYIAYQKGSLTLLMAYLGLIIHVGIFKIIICTSGLMIVTVKEKHLLRNILYTSVEHIVSSLLNLFLLYFLPGVH